MAENSARISELIFRFLNGELSREEQDELEAWQQQRPENGELFRELVQPDSLRKGIRAVYEAEASRTRVQERILGALPVRKVHFMRRWGWAAAVLAGVMVVGAYFFVERQEAPAVLELAQAPIIAPGANKAILTLSDGSKVTLDNAGHQVIPQGAAAVRQQGGRLQYEEKEGSRAIAYNTLSTPRGGQFQVVLSDGTKVWLNAASSLRYPIAFTGKERKVEVSGEAYFEVAQDAAKAFKVMSGGQEVQVLGTHFNIKAYPDEPIIQTTLLEGAVSLSANNDRVLLKPGQQAILAADKGFNIQEVDPNDAVAWKNGYFLFKNESIESVMRTIARWYDVDVSYQGDVLKQRLGGTVSRYEKLDDLLKTIELTKSLKFKIEGRRVTIMP